MYIYTRPSHPLNVQSSLEHFHPHTRIRDFDTYFSPRLPPPPFAFFQPAIHPCSFSFYHHNDSERYEFDEIRVAVEWPTWTCWSRLVKDISHIFFRDVSLPDIHTQRQGITFFASRYQDSQHDQFGHLRVINEDRVAPHTGFGTHSHREFEIFSYIVSGELEQ